MEETEKLLNEMCDIDRRIKTVLSESEINAQEVNQLVDDRDQILQGLLVYASNNSQFASSQEWLNAIANTQQLVELMKEKTDKIGQQLRRFQHGNKSVQQYKKFL